MGDAKVPESVAVPGGIDAADRYVGIHTAAGGGDFGDLFFFFLNGVYDRGVEEIISPVTDVGGAVGDAAVPFAVAGPDAPP